ncbi:hypothetical protein [Blastococcus sp. PRF04-17]|uniref:hypothetical protein n=1 Tax=Blastococcus sp. PRF04-17 TaxID=2933797 RepID=UPI001FF4CC26|nr:hypothetical protein [Blastococcus sp. PRF04-17]UOY03256.1 hypothetical protein MVA48_07905 [Blastococcus sp. PRF04-17]
MTQGPFLYDEEPAPLHTGTPRRRQGVLLLVFGGTVVAAFLMVGASFWIKGSPDDQAREVAGVFLEALEQRDTETAWGLLCEEERARVPAEGVVAEYQLADDGEIASVAGADMAGTPARQVVVDWSDGQRSRLVVISENGPRVCGAALGD